MTERDRMLQRLDAVEGRLAVLSSTPARAEALTEPDPGSGERWDAGQVWAHMAEFVSYWLDQVRSIIAADTEEPVPFGRTKEDAGRIAAIARDRTVSVPVLWSATLTDIESFRSFLEKLDERAWHVRGLHPSRGVMPLDRILDEFLVGHLEQHADQLSTLTAEAS
jgi:hypothetical protein